MAKNVLIFGDSYSTFEGIIPDGYSPYYIPRDWDGTDVRKPEETWWHQVVTEAGFNLLRNDSWSGSTIGYTGYNNSDTSNTSSFIYRFEKMCKEGYFEENQVDVVLIFGGTNDSWCNAPLGEEKYENITREDLFSVLPAFCHFFKIVTEKLPNADVYCLINTELKPEVTNCLESASVKYGITPVKFEKIDKICAHPSIQGMKDIKNAVLAKLK